MVLYECHVNNGKNSSQVFDKYLNDDGYRCYTVDMPSDFNDYCVLHFAFSWAIGGKGEVLPDHIGVPMAEEYFGGTYFMLEVHYDNPTKEKGVRDSSGVNIYYTNKTREYDAGMMYVGNAVMYTQTMPPKQDAFLSIGRCTSECTRAALPADGINVVSGMMHTHLAGEKVHLRHVRDGIESEYVMVDEYYDFNYQITRNLKEEFKVMPGDELMNQCTYNTKDRTGMTYGGFSTWEEMCGTFVRYYPRTDLAHCTSDPTIENVLNSLGVEKLYPDNDNLRISKGYLYFENQVVEEPLKYQNMTVGEVIAIIAWEDEAVGEAYEHNMQYGEHLGFCEGVGDSHNIIQDIITFFPDFEEYVKPKVECPPTTTDTTTTTPTTTTTTTTTTAAASHFLVNFNLLFFVMILCVI